MMMEATVDGQVIPNLARQALLERPANLYIQFLPSTGPAISWTGGELSVQYEMDKLNFDWRMEQMQFTFVPGDIEFTMTQRPDVVISMWAGLCMCRRRRTPIMKPWMSKHTQEELFCRPTPSIFGAVTYEEEDVLTFPQGLFGFEEERSFPVAAIRRQRRAICCAFKACKRHR